MIDKPDYMSREGVPYSDEGMRLYAEAMIRALSKLADLPPSRERALLDRAYAIWTKAYFGDTDDLPINVTRFHDLLGGEDGSETWPDDAFICADTRGSRWLEVGQLPLDGEVVDVWVNGERLANCHRDGSQWWLQYAEGSGRYPIAVEPTHWMPLPNPPAD